jgi:hypothetical protein
VVHRALAIATAPAALALAPGVAAAATLRYEVVRDVLAIGLTAGPGEANRVTVSRDGQSLVFADRIAASLRVDPPTTSCRPAGSSVQRCSALPGGNIVTLDLRDGDDIATVTAAEPTIFEGGTGNDSLTGGPKADEFDGGLGNDSIASRAASARPSPAARHRPSNRRPAGCHDGLRVRQPQLASTQAAAKASTSACRGAPRRAFSA